MKNSKITVKTKSKSYPIYFGNNILNKTGVALLPGSDFGLVASKMMARLSYTDFDGANFLNNTLGSKKLDNADLKKNAPNIVDGVSALKEWSNSL